MARRFPPDRSLRRRAATRAPKLLLCVVCEGERTEPSYLREFARAHGNNLVQLELIAGRAPISVVRKAKDKQVELRRKARKSGDSFAKNFQVWGLFDVDEHPNIANAKEEARAAGIELAISNPCFEVWGLIHYSDHDAPDDRHQVQRKLENLMTGYSRKSKEFNYAEMHPEFGRASTRAKRMRYNRLAEGDEGGRPTTHVDLLLDIVIENGRG